MNRDDQFEKRLQRQPLREIPPAWRDQILSSCEEAKESRQTSARSRAGLLSTFSQQLSALFWPRPAAWIGLASVWVVIVAASVAMQDETPITASRHARPTPQMRELLKQQEQLLAELVGPGEPRDVDRPKTPPRPHSEWRAAFFNT